MDEKGKGISGANVSLTYAIKIEKTTLVGNKTLMEIRQV